MSLEYANTEWDYSDTDGSIWVHAVEDVKVGVLTLNTKGGQWKTAKWTENRVSPRLNLFKPAGQVFIDYDQGSNDYMLLNYGFAIDENPFSAIEIDILELNDAFYNLFRLGIPWTVNPLPGRSGTVHEMIYFEFSVWIRNISWQNSMHGNMMQMWLT